MTEFYRDPATSSAGNPLLQIPVAIFTYLKLIFWPQKLSLYQTEFTMGVWEYNLSVFVTLVVVGLLVFFFKKNKVAFFWLAFFVARSCQRSWHSGWHGSLLKDMPILDRSGFLFWLRWRSIGRFEDAQDSRTMFLFFLGFWLSRSRSAQLSATVIGGMRILYGSQQQKLLLREPTSTTTSAMSMPEEMILQKRLRNSKRRRRSIPAMRTHRTIWLRPTSLTGRLNLRLRTMKRRWKSIPTSGSPTKAWRGSMPIGKISKKSANTLKKLWKSIQRMKICKKTSKPSTPCNNNPKQLNSRQRIDKSICSHFY